MKWCLQVLSGILIAYIVCYAVIWALFEWPWLNILIPLSGFILYKKLGIVSAHDFFEIIERVKKPFRSNKKLGQK